MITKPIKNLKIKGCFHYEKGFNYFRNVDGRIMIGGGRNLDFRKESTTEHGINSKIKKKLINDLKEFIIPNKKFQIDMEWSGIMAFGKTKMPCPKKQCELVELINQTRPTTKIESTNQKRHQRTAVLFKKKHSAPEHNSIKRVIYTEETR